MFKVNRTQLSMLSLIPSIFVGSVSSQEISNLDIFQTGYPKAIYFRYIEGSAANKNITYQQWENRWSKLDGMVVKALDEEVPGRSGEAQQKFVEYKKRNPNKLMLLHFNGNARDPNYRPNLYPANAWTYFVGTYSKEPFSSHTQTIHVKDTDVFRTNHGQRAKYNDDIALVPLSKDNKLDWNQAEQVHLLSINKVQSTITIKRGQFGTKAQDYPYGAYLAPHVAQAPYKKSSKQSLWRYNFSNLDIDTAPSIILAKELLEHFEPGQALSNFDGIAFDVLADSRGRKHHSRKTPIDYHLDGKFDQLDVQAQSQYRLGIHQLLRELRSSFGENKLLIADGNQISQQRETTLLNGIESEEWPNYGDPDVDQWSTGLNRHLYWAKFSQTPILSVIKIGKPNPSHNYDQEGIRKLKIAAALFTDSIIAPAYRANGRKFDKWPELKTKSGNYSWLGKPQSPVEYLRIDSDTNVKISNSSSKINLTASKVSLIADKGKIKHTFDIELTSPSNVVISTELTSKSKLGRDRISYIKLTTNNDNSANTTQTAMSWSGEEPFLARFHFYSLPKGVTSVTLESDADEMIMSDFDIFTGTEIIYRKFDNGIVIANPTREDITFPINRISEELEPRLYLMRKKSATLIKTKDIK